MSKSVGSKSLGGASELLLFIPIKMGIAGGIPYVKRLSILLELLNELRKREVEEKGEDGSGPLDRLQSIYTTQWAVRADPVAPKLLVSACFDRSWEDYVQILVDKTGPLLDLLFLNCEGYDDHTCMRHGYEAFSTWLRSHQLEVSLFHTGLPNITIDDVRVWRKRARGRGDPRVPVTILTPKEEEADQLKQLSQEAQDKAKEDRDKLKNELNQLGILFHDDPIERETFEAAKQSLLAEGPVARVPAKPEDPDLGQIQGNILRSYPNMNHGRAVLVSCPDTGVLHNLLTTLKAENKITTEASGDTNKRLNIALTFAGLVKCGLPKEQIELFPREFVEGMSQRSALIGDVGSPNHPKYWKPLPQNWPEPPTADTNGPTQADTNEPTNPEADTPPSTQKTIDLADVDAVVILQGVYGKSADATDAKAAFNTECKWLEKLGVKILHVQHLYREFVSDDYREHFGFLDSGKVETGSQPVPKLSRALEEKLFNAAEVADADFIPLGELLLGYDDGTGRKAHCADKGKNPLFFDLFKNGTYMVMRKLEQDVRSFKKFVSDSSRSSKGKLSEDDVAARILGRKLDGTPTVDVANPDKPNEFDYSADKQGSIDKLGLKCPIHAHIRRANPRSTPRELTPRIMRRSFSYGSRYVDRTGETGKPANKAVATAASTEVAKGAVASPPSEERGLLFMACNASIARQYEVIQRWLNGGNSTGLSSVENDLLTAPSRGGTHSVLVEAGAEAGPNTIIEDGKKLESIGLDESGVQRPFVTLKWGLYLFVPSIGAIEKMANPVAEGSGATRAMIVTPSEVSPELEALEALKAELGLNDEGPEAHLRWKEVLEGEQRHADAKRVWEAIRKTNNPLQTPYGVLVANADQARTVLSDKTFSVREYWQRLKETIGEHYLGLDQCPVSMDNRAEPSTFDDALYELRVPEDLYERLSTAPNKYIWDELSAKSATHLGARQPTKDSPVDRALALTRASIDDIVAAARAAGMIPPPPQPPRVRLDVQTLVAMTIGRLAEEWIGLPLRNASGFSIATLMRNFVEVSLYSFQPYPDPELRERAKVAGRALVAEYAALPEALQTPMAKAVRDGYRAGSGKASEELVQLALIGAIVGFAPPAIQATMRALGTWIQIGKLPDLVANQSFDYVRNALFDVLKEAPVPPLLYRTALPDAEKVIKGAKSGSFVIVGLQSAWESAQEKDPWKWMFGGDSREVPVPDRTSGTVHGCPGRFAAVDAMVGIVLGILKRKDVRGEGPFALSFELEP